MQAFALLARSPYFLFLVHVYIRLDQTQHNRDIMASCVFIPNTDSWSCLRKRFYPKKVTLLNHIFSETLYHDAKDLTFLKPYLFKL